MAGRNLKGLDRRKTPLPGQETTHVVIVGFGIVCTIGRGVKSRRRERHHTAGHRSKRLISTGCIHFHPVITDAGAEAGIGADLVESLHKHTYPVTLDTRPHQRGLVVEIHAVVHGGVPLIAFHIHTKGNVFGVVDGLIQHQSGAPGTGFRVGLHFHGHTHIYRRLTQAEIIHHVIHICLPGHQVPAAAGDRRSQLQPVQVGIRFRCIHTPAGKLYIPLFLAADQALDVKAIISGPGGIHPAFRVFVGAADFVTVAVFIVVGFVVAASEADKRFLVTDRHAAIHQLAFAIVGTADGQVAGCAVVISKFRGGGGGDHLAAGNRAPAQGAVAGAHFQHRRQRRAQAAGGRIHPARAGTFHPHAIKENLHPFFILATDHRVQTTAPHA